MTISKSAISFLGSGALVLGFGFVASWLVKRKVRNSESVSSPDERTPAQPLPRERNAQASASARPGRAQLISDILELRGTGARAAALGEGEPVQAAAARDARGAWFLAQATDALSPFGEHAHHPHLDLDQVWMESGMMTEGNARAANGEELAGEASERAAESERRPTPKPPSQKLPGGRS